MLVRGGVGAAVFVGAAVGVAVGAVVGAVVGAAVVGAAVDGLGAAVAGAAVRIWIVALGETETEALALGDGDAVVPARRASPPPKSTPMSSSVSRPPATAARMRSIQRGPRRGGGVTIRVVSDMPTDSRTQRAARARGVVGSEGDAIPHRFCSGPRLVCVAVRCSEPNADSDRVGDCGHGLSDSDAFTDRSGDELTCLH